MTTANPVPSADVDDLVFNVQRLDEAVSSSADTYVDRLGVQRLTLTGATSRITALNPRGAWATATLYQPKDLVIDSGTLYIALDTHTSGATFAGDLTAHWRPEQGVTYADLNNAATNTKGSGQVGHGVLSYPANTAGGALFTTVWGAGATDRAAQITAANALGLPIRIIGACTVSSPVTITVPIVDTVAQIFASSAQVTIDNGLAVRPEWFGPSGGRAGLIRNAVNALPSRGGTVLCADTTYRSGYDTATGAMFNNRGGTPGTDYMVKPRVRIQGTKLPEYNSGHTALVNGTIIEGTLYISSECSGFSIDLVGVDVGPSVIATMYGGADHDGLCFLQCNKTTPVYGEDVHIGRVRSLGSGAASLAHGCLFEAILGGFIEYAEARNANHGVVIKSKRVSAGTLVGRGNVGNDVIFKSDTYAGLDTVEVGNVMSSSISGTDPGHGVLVQAGTANGGGVQIANLWTRDKAIGIEITVGAGLIFDNVQIGQVQAQSCGIGYTLSGGPTRCAVDQMFFTGCTTAFSNDSSTTSRSNRIASLVIENASIGLSVAGKLKVGHATYNNISTYASSLNNTSARLMIGDYTAEATSVVLNGPPTLAGTWASHAGGNAFKAELKENSCVLSGLIQGGGSTTIITALPVPLRPAENYRFPCLAYDGSTYTTVEVLVTTAGAVSVNSITPASTYLSLSGVSWPISY